VVASPVRERDKDAVFTNMSTHLLQSLHGREAAGGLAAADLPPFGPHRPSAVGDDASFVDRQVAHPLAEHRLDGIAVQRDDRSNATRRSRNTHERRLGGHDDGVADDA
jgi:hypothetical protein